MNVALLESWHASEITVVLQGLVDYQVAWELQRENHLEVANNQRGNTLLLLEHPSIYTAGRRTQDSERPTDGSQVIDVDRGGRITWHGPGQLVGYPIVKLCKPTELVGFVREIEAALIEVCSALGVVTTSIEGRSGVWVADARGTRKVAAIGIRVAKGVSMHGFALNVNPDLTAFSKIIPCGINDSAVTSLEVELQRKISVSEVIPLVEQYMVDALRKVST